MCFAICRGIFIFFLFDEITWTPVVGFARNLVEIVPRRLPELFKQLGDQNHTQKIKNMSDKILIENEVEMIKYYFMICTYFSY